MVTGFAGWHLLFVLLYIVIVVAIIVAVIFAIRWAVLSALKAHTRWIDSGKP
jgi:uncharacterized membrane protein